MWILSAYYTNFFPSGYNPNGTVSETNKGIADMYAWPIKIIKTNKLSFNINKMDVILFALTFVPHTKK